MLNKVHLIGNLGADPDINTVIETKVANFSLATSETYTDKNGERQTKTQWHRVVVWGKLADVIEKFVKKGSKIYVEGKVEYRQYEQDGVTKYSTDIVVNHMQMLDSKKDAEQNSSPEPAAKKTPITVPDTQGDDLPF